MFPQKEGGRNSRQVAESENQNSLRSVHSATTLVSCSLRYSVTCYLTLVTSQCTLFIFLCNEQKQGKKKFVEMEMVRWGQVTSWAASCA